MIKNRKQKLFFVFLSLIPVLLMCLFPDTGSTESWLAVQKRDGELTAEPAPEHGEFQWIVERDDDLFFEKNEIPAEEKSGSLIGELPQTVLETPQNQVEKRAPVYLQLQYIPFLDYYVCSNKENVTGLAVGYHLQQKEVNGLSLGLVQAFKSNMNGVSFSLLELSGNFCGMSMFLAGGAVNNHGCLIGLWNITENNKGLQIGLFNQASEKSMEFCVLDMAESEKGFGFQAGLVNYSDSPGIQFGLWNTNPNSWITHFPIFNFCF